MVQRGLARRRRADHDTRLVREFGAVACGQRHRAQRDTEDPAAQDDHDDDRGGARYPATHRGTVVRSTVTGVY